MCYAVDLRRANGEEARAAGFEVPQDFWGNAVTLQVVMPPPAPGASALTQSERARDILAAAACAVHAGTQGLRSDPAFMSHALGLHSAMMDMGFWKQLLADPGFNTFRDCAAMASSWRGGTMDRADFGQGKPWLVAGERLSMQHCQTHCYQAIYWCHLLLRASKWHMHLS